MNTFATLKTKRWFRIVFTFLKILLVLYIVWNLLVSFLTWPNYWDDKTINDADLIPVMKEAVASELNAATYLPIQNDITDFEKSILTKKPEFKDKQFYIEGEIVSGARLQKFILDSQPLVAEFEKAATQSIYECPLSLNKYDVDTEFCQLGTLRSLATLIAFHTEFVLRNNNVSRAGKLTSTLLKVGHLIVEQKNPAAVIEHLVGMAIMGIALDTIEAHPELKKILTSQILEYSVSDESSVRVLRANYLTSKNMILLGFTGEAETEKNIANQGAYFLRPKETVNNLAEFSRLNIKSILIPCNETSNSTIIDELMIKNKESSSLRNFYRPNIMGKILLATVLAPLDSIRDRRCEINNRLTIIAK